MILKNLMNKIEKFYPKNYAQDWDNVGLQIGDPDSAIQRVLTALEINDDIISEALEMEIDLIVVHHPLIFKEIKSLNTSGKNNQWITKLIKNDISVYCLHTNLDIANNGMNDWLAEIIGIKDTKILKNEFKHTLYQIEIEIDEYAIEEVIKHIKEIGIGRTINNEENLWLAPKIKRFKNKKHVQAQERDVVIIQVLGTKEQENSLHKRLFKLKKEKSINYLVLVKELSNMSINMGIGRYGTIKKQNLEQIVCFLQKTFGNSAISFVGNREKIIKNVAVVGGSGSSYIYDAKKKNCDLLITGDIKYHDAQLAKQLNICLIDQGHYMEIIFNDVMASFLKLFDDIEVFPSEVDVNPFEIL